MSELSRTRAEARGLLKEIEKLGSTRPNAVGGRFHEDIERLVGEHAALMSPLRACGGWERNGVAMCCECGETFFIEELRGSFMARRCPLCGSRIDGDIADVAARLLSENSCYALPVNPVGRM